MSSARDRREAAKLLASLEQSKSLSTGSLFNTPPSSSAATKRQPSARRISPSASLEEKKEETENPIKLELLQENKDIADRIPSLSSKGSADVAMSFKPLDVEVSQKSAERLAKLRLSSSPPSSRSSPARSPSAALQEPMEVPADLELPVSSPVRRSPSPVRTPEEVSSPLASPTARMAPLEVSPSKEFVNEYVNRRSPSPVSARSTSSFRSNLSSPMEVPADLELPVMEKPKEIVEERLIAYGYYPLSKIVEDGEKAIFIKCRNRYGETVYVELDTLGFTSFDKDKMTFVKSGKLNEIPYSIQVGDLDCSKSDICGLVYDCKEGVCVIKNTVSGPVKSEYVYTEKSKDRNLVGSDNVAHPVIRMSEIVANPEAILKHTHEYVRRLRKQAYQDGADRIRKGEELVQRFLNSYHRFGQSVKEVERGFGSDIDKLQKYSDEYFNILESIPLEQRGGDLYRYNLERQRKVSEELAFRSSYLVEMISACAKFTDELSILENSIKFLDSKVEYLQSLKGKIDQTFAVEEKKM